jgi:hypothetical protein
VEKFRRPIKQIPALLLFVATGKFNCFANSRTWGCRRRKKINDEWSKKNN